LSKLRFDAVYRLGKRVNGEYCRISVLEGTGLVGFTTPKKLGNTPRRNRMKRRMREAVRESRSLLDASWDTVFLATMQANGASFAELAQDVRRAIERMRKRWESESE
jgi:ribonuclease P protein component